MSEEIFDVILHTTGHFHPDVYTFQENRPPRHFDLGENYWVGSLPHGIKEKVVFDACEPAGFNFTPTRQYGMRYAICRRVEPSGKDYYVWDSDFTIGNMVSLSRLVRPTTIAYSYSARLYFNEANLETIVPGPTQGLGAYAWVVAKDTWRDWLSVSEFNELRNFSVINITVPARVRRARKHITHAFHASYLDQRFASLVTSFESLLQTSRNKVTKQFALRVPKLAETLGYELTGTEAEAMYSDRSAFVHGSDVSFRELTDDLIEQYDRFERVIRLALLRGSTESSFAQLFDSPESVENAFGKL